MMNVLLINTIILNRRAYMRILIVLCSPREIRGGSLRSSLFSRRWIRTILCRFLCNSDSDRSFIRCLSGLPRLLVCIDLLWSFFSHSWFGFLIWRGRGFASWVLWFLFCFSRIWIYGDGLIGSWGGFLWLTISRRLRGRCIYRIWIFTFLLVFRVLSSFLCSSWGRRWAREGWSWGRLLLPIFMRLW